MLHPATGVLLLVEDHDLSAALMVQLLRGSFPSLEIRRARTAGEGLAEFVRLRPCLLVIDVGLPDGSGIELARRIAAMDARAAMVVHSMHDSAVIREGALAAGARAFVSKQEPAGLIRVVARLLEAAGIENSPQGTPGHRTDGGEVNA